MNNFREAALIVVLFVGLLFCAGAVMNGEAERRAFCSANLKKLHQYTMSYENDCGSLPPVCIPAKPLWKFWSNCLQSYASSPLDFACPSDSRAAYMFEAANPLYSPRELKIACYGMNWFLEEKAAKKKGHATARLQFLSTPERIVLFGDSKGPYMLPPRFWSHERAFRHEGESANFIFADGSVRLMKQNDFGQIAPNGEFKTDFTKWYWN